MFIMCEAMRWNHLPVAGGLYDQHPDLIEKFMYIFAEKAEQEAREEKKKKTNQMGGSPPPGM